MSESKHCSEWYGCLILAARCKYFLDLMIARPSPCKQTSQLNRHTEATCTALRITPCDYNGVSVKKPIKNHPALEKKGGPVTIKKQKVTKKTRITSSCSFSVHFLSYGTWKVYQSPFHKFNIWSEFWVKSGLKNQFQDLGP